MLLCFLNCLYIFQKIVFCEILCVKFCCILTLGATIQTYMHITVINISENATFRISVSLHSPKCCVLLYVVVFWPFGATIQIYIHTYNSNQHFRSWRWSFVVFVKCCVSWIVFAFSRMLCILKCCCVLTLGGHHTSTVINSTCVFRKRRCCNKLILRN